MGMNIADVEDSYLAADLFEEWKEEYEKNFYEPLNEIVMVGVAENITPEELEQLKEINPEAWQNIMEIREELMERQKNRE